MEPDKYPSMTMPTPVGLKKVQPYWYPYTTMAKLRWLNRELLEVVSSEFRDRSMEYYRYALESGVTTVNGKVARPDTIIKNGDRIENIVHRHEPPVTSTPIKILHHDVEREFIVVDKPGSIPVHGTGRYFKNTLIEILQHEFGFKTYPVNRLDRLTSGLMILPLSSKCAHTMAKEFEVNTVHKEYVTRCKGEFPVEEITCEEPLITLDRQMGLNIVHPEGKPAKTVFKRIRYDENTDTSVVLCTPFTGRSHQIRVHLQFLGHPVANDPVYSEKRIWGESLGKGGIDTTPSDERSAPVPPPHLEQHTAVTGNPESLTRVMPQSATTDQVPAVPSTKLLPRETGEDIGLCSPVPLSSQAVGVITQLRNMKDEDEDWGRWRDVVFRVKGALSPANMKIVQVPQNRRRRGNAKFVSNPNEPAPGATSAGNTATIGSPPPAFAGARILGASTSDASPASTSTMVESTASFVAPDQGVPIVHGSRATTTSTSQAEGAVLDDSIAASSSSSLPDSTATMHISHVGETVSDNEISLASSSASLLASAHPEPAPPASEDLSAAPQPPQPSQFTVAEAVNRASEMEAQAAATTTALSENSYCPECYLPLHPDPKPEKLYIFLHALRYTTSLGKFETPMPEWAQEGWEWDRS
ncbi:PseudoU-synth-2 domain-containing protein [Mycena sanguinolenta]|uniref:PseudoU-synth-2 domain-containing protein n=1 Tax=Mycena sanguinolenta TaxID=230812 RepID=A0A8H7CWT0_9AGAR|nr:PseudoU-synth-2 domain-containing protein [Mycena sanguinolenta]